MARAGHQSPGPLPNGSRRVSQTAGVFRQIICMREWRSGDCTPRTSMTLHLTDYPGERLPRPSLPAATAGRPNGNVAPLGSRWLDGVEVCIAFADPVAGARYARWLMEAGATTSVVEQPQQLQALVESDPTRFQFCLIDLHHPGCDALALAESLEKTPAPCHTVLVGDAACDRTLDRILGLPRTSCLSTAATRSDLILMLKERSRSQAPDLAAMFARTNNLYRLAPQQRRLLWLNLWGYSDEEIASKLGISRHTVQDYQLALRKKTGVRSKAGYLRLLMEVAGAQPPAEMARLLEPRSAAD